MGLALCAGLVSAALWGILYIFPLLLPEYGSFQSGVMRCCVTGLFSIGLLVPLWKQVRQLKLADWVLAGKLAVIGCLINFLAQVYCSEFSGSSVAGMSTGIIPVIVTILSNERDRRLGRWSLSLKKLVTPLVIIFVGFVMCNYSEFVTNPMQSSPTKFFIGLLLGLTHTAIWTWYPVVNAEWIQRHPKIGAVTWTATIFSLLFPFAGVTYLAGLFGLVPGVEITFLGPAPIRFILVMLVSGIASSWGGMMLWNYMCKHVPTSLAGQMMVFETMFAILFAHILQQRFPALDLVVGTILLTLGVCIMFELFRRNKESIKESIKSVANTNTDS